MVTTSSWLTIPTHRPVNDRTHTEATSVDQPVTAVVPTIETTIDIKTPDDLGSTTTVLVADELHSNPSTDVTEIVTSVTDEIVTPVADEIATPIIDEIVTSATDEIVTSVTDEIVTSVTDEIVTSVTEVAIVESETSDVEAKTTVVELGTLSSSVPIVNNTVDTIFVPEDTNDTDTDSDVSTTTSQYDTCSEGSTDDEVPLDTSSTTRTSPVTYASIVGRVRSFASSVFGATTLPIMESTPPPIRAIIGDDTVDTDDVTLDTTIVEPVDININTKHVPDVAKDPVDDIQVQDPVEDVARDTVDDVTEEHKTEVKSENTHHNRRTRNRRKNRNKQRRNNRKRKTKQPTPSSDTEPAPVPAQKPNKMDQIFNNMFVPLPTTAVPRCVLRNVVANIVRVMGGDDPPELPLHPIAKPMAVGNCVVDSDDTEVYRLVKRHGYNTWFAATTYMLSHNFMFTSRGSVEQIMSNLTTLVMLAPDYYQTIDSLCRYMTARLDDGMAFLSGSKPDRVMTLPDPIVPVVINRMLLRVRVCASKCRSRNGQKTSNIIGIIDELVSRVIATINISATCVRTLHQFDASERGLEIARAVHMRTYLATRFRRCRQCVVAGFQVCTATPDDCLSTMIAFTNLEDTREWCAFLDDFVRRQLV
jgi:sRNA-binding protein/large-conductance mechanosensitive channel